jgi:hypothetical protein
MRSEFIQASDFLQRELQEFFRALRRNKGNKALMQAAGERLRTVVYCMEAFGDDPGEEWESLSIEQRWGYLRLASLLGTAVYELKRLGVAV